jgi:hypothetical protein
MKRQTISQNHIRLSALISNLDGVEAAILIERIRTSALEITDNKDKVREAMKGSFISPELYIGTMEKVENFLNH